MPPLASPLTEGFWSDECHRGHMNKLWPTVRDILLFVGGMAGTANEALVREAERPTLLLLFAAMMGLPAFLRQDEQRRNGGGG